MSGDLSDLPAEVIAELSGKRIDPLEVSILSLFADKPLHIDDVIIGLWRTHNIAVRRRFLMNKLYRMKLRRLLFSVPNTKGLYRKDPS